MESLAITEAAKAFSICGDFAGAVPYGSGHINDTYLASFDEDGKLSQYVIQRINHNVFKDPAAVMENIVRVTEHIRKKLKGQGADCICRRVLTVVPTQEGSNYYKDGDGNYWRALNFVKGTKTVDTAQSLEQIYEAARTFGTFQNLLADLGEPALNETIPDFHNGPKRFEAFKTALEEDRCSRVGDVKAEIEFLQDRSFVFDVVPKLLAGGEIPVRVTHNDTKINNVLFDDATGKGLCVIDLDTVMPGSSLYDFGDIVRSTISKAVEDERDISKVIVELPRFEAAAKGYLSAARGFLNEVECRHLVHAGILITLIMGTRFLTDYLKGDEYFKIHRKGQNLDRCRVQFKLVELMMQRQEEMESIINKQF
jgi:hypothetical protein